MQAMPPYISWSAFVRVLESLDLPVPDRIDASRLAGLSTSTSSQVLQAMRFLNLVRSDGEVTPDLRLLIEHPESRVPIIARLLRQSYPELFAVGHSRIQAAAIESLISRSGLKPATQRKAVIFVMNAAIFVGLPVDATASSPAREISQPPLKPAMSQPEQSSKRSFSLELASGGVIDVALDFDPFRLRKDDREFIFDLIDTLRSYETRRSREQRTEGDHEDRRADAGEPF